MSGKRPTDHLEPSAKKRGSEKQITKDEGEESAEEHEEPGTFQRASDEVLKQRKIIKARRPAQGSAGAAVPASPANPFAGIQLAPATENPFAGIQLAPAPVPAQTVAPSVGSGEDTQVQGDVEGAEDVATAVPDSALAEAPVTTAEASGTKETTSGSAAPEAPAVETAPVDAVASAAPTPEAQAAPSPAAPTPAVSSIFGGGLASASAGGGFGSLASKGTAPAFSFGAAFGGAAGTGAAATPMFSFAGGSAPAFSFAAPSTAASPHSDKAASPGEQDSNGAPASPTFTPVASLPAEVPQATGEEDETTVFSGDGVLFEFDASKQWRERGSGEMRVNLGKESKQGRLVMRQRGNLRLLMNANLWPDMPAARMEGGKGVTFAVINAVSGEEGEAAGEGAPAPSGEGQLSTFALRIRNPDVLAAFLMALEAHKAGAKPAE
ncbi:NUP50B [Auxenochlorella protothecoides x Auxenochlorella symbiontica]